MEAYSALIVNKKRNYSILISVPVNADNCLICVEDSGHPPRNAPLTPLLSTSKAAARSPVCLLNAIFFYRRPPTAS